MVCDMRWCGVVWCLPAGRFDTVELLTKSPGHNSSVYGIAPVPERSNEFYICDDYSVYHLDINRTEQDPKRQRVLGENGGNKYSGLRGLDVQPPSKHPKSQLIVTTDYSSGEVYAIVPETERSSVLLDRRRLATIPGVELSSELKQKLQRASEWERIPGAPARIVSPRGVAFDLSSRYAERKQAGNPYLYVVVERSQIVRYDLEAGMLWYAETRGGGGCDSHRLRVRLCEQMY